MLPGGNTRKQTRTETEMKPMKKWLSVILAMALLLTAFSAFAEDVGSTPPEAPPGGFDGGTPPGDPPGEPPEGFDGSNPPEPPDGFGGGNPPGDPPSGGGGFGGGTPPGAQSADITYVAATEISGESASLTQQNETYVSDTSDENALLITRAGVTLDNPSVSKTGDSDGGDSCNFYGLNAAVLVMGGSTTTITGGTITSDASGANGVFSYGGNGGPTPPARTASSATAATAAGTARKATAPPCIFPIRLSPPPATVPAAS